MQVSPCLHPIRTFNATLGTYVNVPCGSCSACIASKGYLKKSQIIDGIQHYKCKAFVTLTYDDYHLPLAKYNCDADIVHQVDFDYNGSLKSLSLSRLIDSDYDYYLECVNRFGGMPVLSHRDIILFKKRFRYYFKKSCKNYGIQPNPIYIFCAGEYGSTYFRPHYHILFGVHSEREFNLLQECVYQAWQFPDRVTKGDCSSSGTVCRSVGKIDFQRIIDNGSYGYVAQYLGCVTQLPHILQCCPFRPFAQISDIEVRKINGDKLPTLQQFYAELPVQITVNEPGKTGTMLVDVPKSLESKYFPKLPRIDQISKRCWYRLYAIPFRFPCKAKEFADRMIDCFVNSAFLDDDLKLLKYLYYDKEDYWKTYNVLVRFFYCARRVCNNILSLSGSCASDISSIVKHYSGKVFKCFNVHEYVERLISYYSRKELFKLRKFYNLINELQDDYYNPCSLEQIFTLYYDTEDTIKNLNYYISQFSLSRTHVPVSICELPAYATYKFKCDKIVNDTTKTKKRNGFFESKGWQRPSYYPFVNKKYLRFL